MFFEKEIATNGRVIILDESLSIGIRETLMGLETTDGQEVVFLEDQYLAAGLEEILQKISSPGTLFVFPGNGSGFPRRLSQVCRETQTHGVDVYAKRFWVPGEDPEVSVELICPERFIILGVKNIVVVDDVISSGRTMRLLYQKNAWRFPGARWRACTWGFADSPFGEYPWIQRGVRGVLSEEKSRNWESSDKFTEHTPKNSQDCHELCSPAISGTREVPPASRTLIRGRCSFGKTTRLLLF